jgi:NAD(P)-dependent dehydrogenase (short-subunit alcohol dehydrogenase family)
MSSVDTSEFRVCSEESAAFARLSGDYNPLHLDAIAARRTQYGRTVVHGIHLVLKAFDRIAAIKRCADLEPTEISGTFNNPVRTGAPVQLRITLDAESRRFRFIGESELRPAFAVTLLLGERRAAASREYLDCAFPADSPLAQSFPPTTASGSVPRRLSHAILAGLFPALSGWGDSGWIADLLATTRVVGMRCPGLDSIYSAFKLRRIQDRTGSESMQFAVERSDPRVRMIRMHVAGGALDGSVEAFFRPPPVEQRRLADVIALVPPHAFQSQNALVIGGSRGLGELTAKIVMAGGGTATLTYARGAADAERVCAEARQLGRRCSAQQLDLDVASIDDLPQWLGTTPYSHAYFFASPPIASNNTRQWNHGLFEQFAHFYVRSFAVLVERLLNGRPAQNRTLRFLYPSTIFLDTPTSGFAEYCAAKAAGESLCDNLARQYNVRFVKPRLPRMRTDQTSGLLDSGAQDPFAILLNMVREFDS